MNYMKLRKNKNITFVCPFCKRDIISSKKTEVFYRNNWVDGCSDCYILSIEQNTEQDFQLQNIQNVL